MAKRARASRQQRVTGEAARRAAAVLRLAQVPSSRRAEPEPAGAGFPAPAGPVGWERLEGPAEVSVCAAGCPVCAEAGERFTAIRAQSVEQRRRFDQPDRYPYAAGKHTLHQATCREITQSVGQVQGDDSIWMQGALTRFAHDGTLDSGWATHKRMMEPGEAAAWVAERIGPRGGIRYRLCRICTPQLPAAG
ncbi:hypothetical protein AB0F30_37200 [Streptomyces sp. NPDC029006]|uniref:hypothetical protein n=1 Tax=Streptomyces sp. NPDC029006 TaxID=3155467 RepID=UPI0033C6548B